MINKKWWSAGVSLLLLTGLLTFLTESYIGSQPQKKPARPRVTKSSNSLTVEEFTKQEPRVQATVLSTQTNGWGFAKNKNHLTPGITAGQARVIDKYNVLFVADEKKKEIVLTFDLGYENGYTGRILDTLQKHHVNAIFFVTGPWLKGNLPLAKRMVAEGHIIGNHTWSHPSLPTLNKKQLNDDIQKLQKEIELQTGQKADQKYLRPPKGEYSEQSLQWTNELGYQTVLWSIALKDWLPMSGPQEAIDGVTKNLHKGAVILLHGVSKDVTEGLDQILNNIKTKGYKIIPITEVK